MHITRKRRTTKINLKRRRLIRVTAVLNICRIIVADGVTMADFEDVRLCDLSDRAARRARQIMEERNVSLLKELGEDVQAVYDFFVSSKKSFETIRPTLKNLFSSFNYAAVIVNDGIKRGTLDRQANELLQQCLEIIIKCAEVIKAELCGNN